MRLSSSRSSPTLRRSSRTPFWPNHWNGVCAFGTNPPTDAVQLAFLVCVRPIFTTSRASSAIPRVSTSVSVGRPVRKYSFTRCQPCEYAPSTAAYRSSSVMSLLITWRIRHVPPSGANVSPVRRTFWISLAMPTVNASTRREGNDTLDVAAAGLVVDDAGDEAVDPREVGACSAT